MECDATPRGYALGVEVSPSGLCSPESDVRGGGDDGSGCSSGGVVVGGVGGVGDTWWWC